MNYENTRKLNRVKGLATRAGGFLKEKVQEKMAEKKELKATEKQAYHEERLHQARIKGIEKAKAQTKPTTRNFNGITDNYSLMRGETNGTTTKKIIN